MSNILIISGSSQINSQSLRISQYLKEVLNDNASTDILDLNKDNLPIFLSTPSSNWAKVETQLAQATAYIFVIPEWNGGANPSIKNMLLYANSDLLGHKPVMLVGISAGRGGFYPLMDMRSTGHKDTRYVISPEYIVINNCKEQLLNLELDNKADDYQLKLRINYALNILKLYQKALDKIRNSGKVDHQTYPFGA